MAAGAPDRSRTAWIALGSNQGDSLTELRRAVSGLAAVGEVVARSSIYATDPVGGPPGQPQYLNAVVAVTTDMTTHGLLRALLDLEKTLGRVREVRWGPRNIDIDLLAHGDVNIDDPVATVPHPRLHHRAFVLVPLAEVDRGWRHPVTDEGIDELLGRLDASGVRLTDLDW